MMLTSRTIFQTKNYKVILNLIQALPYKLFMSKQQTARVEDPETSSGIPCFVNNNYVGRRSRTETFRDDLVLFTATTGGFTLIELLVVVLIIGILAAVALPQYQKAVLKSRNMQALIVGKAFIDAQRAYHLANGKFATDRDALDITIPNMPSWQFIGPHSDGHGQLIYNYPSYDLTWDLFPQISNSLRCIVKDQASNTKLLNEVCQSVTGTTTYTPDSQVGGRKTYNLFY